MVGRAGPASASIIISAETETVGMGQIANPPKTHVGFDQEKVADAARVRGAGGRFEHVPAILRMKYWRRNDTFWRQRKMTSLGGK